MTLLLSFSLQRLHFWFFHTAPKDEHCTALSWGIFETSLRKSVTVEVTEATATVSWRINLEKVTICAWASFAKCDGHKRFPVRDDCQELALGSLVFLSLTLEIWSSAGPYVVVGAGRAVYTNRRSLWRQEKGNGRRKDNGFCWFVDSLSWSLSGSLRKRQFPLPAPPSPERTVIRLSLFLTFLTL